VGLQEVSVIDIDLNGPACRSSCISISSAILQAKLAQRGLHYDLAAQVQNITARRSPGSASWTTTLCSWMPTGKHRVGGRPELRRERRHGSPRVVLKRGWVWARVTIGGGILYVRQPARGGGPRVRASDGLRALQLGEVVGTVGGDAKVMMMGDFNDVPGSAMHQVVTGAASPTVWAASAPASSASPAATWPTCRIRLHRSPAHRLCLERGSADPEAKLFGRIDRFGDVPSDRPPGGRPSDLAVGPRRRAGRAALAFGSLKDPRMVAGVRT